MTVEVPAGYTPNGPTSRTATPGAEATADFALAHPSSLGGSVTDGDGNPVADAVVVISGATGEDVALSTDADGGYYLANLPADDYRITLTVTDGYTAAMAERTATITAAGENRLDEDSRSSPTPCPAPSSPSPTPVPPQAQGRRPGRPGRLTPTTSSAHAALATTGDPATLAATAALASVLAGLGLLAAARSTRQRALEQWRSVPPVNEHGPRQSSPPDVVT